LIADQIAIFVIYALFNPLLMIAFASLRKINAIQKLTKKEWQEKLKLIAAILLLLNLPGSLYLHSLPIQYDIPLHFFATFASLIALMLLYPVLFKIFKGEFPTTKHVIWISFVLIVIFGFGLEGFQKTADTIFNTKMFFDVTQPIVVDFWVDISMNVTGALAGLFYMSRRPQFIQSFLLTSQVSPDRAG